MEKILCSAIWYRDLIPDRPHPCNTANNIEGGIVLCGWRHGNIIAQMIELTGRRTVTNAPDGVGDYEQGFLTSKNRFVGREEAFDIAEAANQLNDRNRFNNRTLFSEDLY